MLRYIGRRLLQTIPVFFGATFLIFAMVYLMPGDPVAALGGDRGLTEAAAAKIRAEYHLDQPFWMQYLLYLKGVFTLDFGKSFNQQPVIDVMARAFPVTMALAIYALAIESIFGITLGTIAGVRRGGWFDSTILVFSLLLISVPTFVLGFVLQFLLGIKLGILPVTASVSVDFASLTMPAMVLGGVSLAYVIRLTRQSVSENVSADYVRTARAKGLTNRAVMSRHILRNSLIPVATFLGGDLGALMGGAIITEGIFNINGVGGTLWQAIRLGRGPPPSCPSRPCSSSSTSWPTLSLTSSTPCSTRGSAMSDFIPSANISRTRAGQDPLRLRDRRDRPRRRRRGPRRGRPLLHVGRGLEATARSPPLLVRGRHHLRGHHDLALPLAVHQPGPALLRALPLARRTRTVEPPLRLRQAGLRHLLARHLRRPRLRLRWRAHHNRRRHHRRHDRCHAGYVGGWIDALLSRITDVFFAIPLLLAAIVFMQMFKESRSIAMVVIVLSTFAWTSIARITRGSVMSAKNEEFVTAARATGASRGRILMSHIIPNSMAPIIVYATVALAPSSCPRPPCPSWASACRPRSSPGVPTSQRPKTS